jgi:hypothetical protein
MQQGETRKDKEIASEAYHPRQEKPLMPSSQSRPEEQGIEAHSLMLVSQLAPEHTES